MELQVVEQQKVQYGRAPTVKLVKFIDKTSIFLGRLLPFLLSKYYRFWTHAGLHTHCKKNLAISPSPAGMSLTKLSLAGKNLIIPDQGEFG